MNRQTTYPMLHAAYLQRQDDHPKLIIHRLDMRPKRTHVPLAFRLPATLTAAAGIALYWLLS